MRLAADEKVEAFLFAAEKSAQHSKVTPIEIGFCLLQCALHKCRHPVCKMFTDKLRLLL